MIMEKRVSWITVIASGLALVTPGLFQMDHPIIYLGLPADHAFADDTFGSLSISDLRQAMMAHIDFITTYTTLNYQGQRLPEAKFVSEEEMQSLSHTPFALSVAERRKSAVSRVSAFYDPESQTIYLADQSSVYGSALLHEMVHYLQDINGKEEIFADHRVCLEAEAYDVQTLWHDLYELDPDLRPSYGYVMTLNGACNDADFSWKQAFRSD